MVEQKEVKLEPKVSDFRDSEGNVIHNLSLKTRVDKVTGEVTKGLADGEYIIVIKKFAEAKPTRYGGAARVLYDGKVCNFFVTEKQVPLFNAAGGVGDKVKVSAYSYSYTYQGETKKTLGLKFEKVD